MLCQYLLTPASLRSDGAVLLQAGTPGVKNTFMLVKKVEQLTRGMKLKI